MPNREFFQDNPNDELLMEIEQRLKALERQVKKIHELDTYLKRIIKVEERLFHLQEIHKGDIIKDMERHVVTEVKQLMDQEIRPIQHMFKEFYNKTLQLEKQVASLEKKTTEDLVAIQDLLDKKIQSEAEKKIHPHEGQPIIFQEIHIDKFFMDKYEQTNNLGQLGIKELSGHLNIGATYDKGVIPNELVEEWKKEMHSLQQMKENSQEKETDDDGSEEEG